MVKDLFTGDVNITVLYEGKMDYWDVFVIITRKDGTTRNVPLPQWTDHMASRVLEAGGSFLIPEEPDYRAPDFGENIKQPPKISHDDDWMSQKDEEVIDALETVEHLIRTKSHVATFTTIVDYYKRYTKLSVSLRDKADSLLKKYSRGL